jgi:hypothetical protein
MPAILVVCSAASLAACGSTAGPSRPLALLGGVAVGSATLGGEGPSGVTVKFIDRGRFFVAVLLRNRSHSSVQVVDARTQEPAGSLVHQVGTRLAPFTPCTGRRLCLFVPTGTDAARLTPVTLAPGADVGVRLNYQLGSCGDVPHATLTTAQLIAVSFRDAKGDLRRQTLAIGGARLHLLRPAGVECVPRPYSHVGLVGSFTTSPGHLPVAGSDGDTCTESSRGRLFFRSRLFTDRDGIQFRVQIAIPHFVGKGVYGTSRIPARLGPANVIVSGAFGAGGGTTFYGRPATVTVTRAAGALFGGRFQATLSGRRRFFRAYGAWRCTTKLE